MILKTGKQLEKEMLAKYENIEKFIEKHEEYEFEKETLEEIFSGKEFLNALEYSDLVLIFDSNLRIENDIENNVELERILDDFFINSIGKEGDYYVKLEIREIQGIEYYHLIDYKYENYPNDDREGDWIKIDIEDLTLLFLEQEF
nr:MAG TPA: hypothetical protein [Caudoviricetes sp.]